MQLAPWTARAHSPGLLLLRPLLYLPLLCKLYCRPYSRGYLAYMLYCCFVFYASPIARSVVCAALSIDSCPMIYASPIAGPIRIVLAFLALKNNKLPCHLIANHDSDISLGFRCGNIASTCQLVVTLSDGPKISGRNQLGQKN